VKKFDNQFLAKTDKYLPNFYIINLQAPLSHVWCSIHTRWYYTLNCYYPRTTMIYTLLLRSEEALFILLRMISKKSQGNQYQQRYKVLDVYT